MSSVLQANMMQTNPVGNQIRRLDAALAAERADKQMLLLALETKAPEVFSEYMRLRDEAAEKAAMAQRAQQLQQQPQRFQASVRQQNARF
jgi:hypothetical protein